MAVQYFSGFEVCPAYPISFSKHPDGGMGAPQATRDTTVKRIGGVASLKVVPASQTQVVWSQAPSGFGSNPTVYQRVYILVNSVPTADCAIMGFNANSLVRMTTGAEIYSSIDSAQKSATIDDGQWHRIDYYTKIHSTQASRAWELRVDGVTVGSGTAQTTDSSLGGATWVGAWAASAFSASFNFDDYRYQDTGWCPDGYVISMLPVSDSSRGSWTGGAGGTTNLWDALNNIPPTGAAGPGTNTSQIRTTVASQTYQANMQTIIQAGGRAGDTPLVMLAGAIVGVEGTTAVVMTVSAGGLNNFPSVSRASTINTGFAIDTYSGGNGWMAVSSNPPVAGGAMSAPYPDPNTAPLASVTSDSTASPVEACSFLMLSMDIQPPQPVPKSLAVNYRMNSPSRALTVIYNVADRTVRSWFHKDYVHMKAWF